MTSCKWGVLVALLAAVGVGGHAAAASIDAADLLARSDRGRGGGAPGLIWDVVIRTSGSGMPEENMRMHIKANDSASLAETLEPIKSKGSKMLQAGRTMWLSRPGLKKPIPISPRQRLSGLVSVGDIAAANYNRDYQAEILRQDEFKGEPCYVLALTAREQKTTYDKITYWVSIDRSVGVYAEFLSLSGKRLKTAEFIYDNRLTVQGREIPFISLMTIADTLTDAKTTLEFGQVKVQPIPASEFDVTHLQ